MGAAKPLVYAVTGASRGLGLEFVTQVCFSTIAVRVPLVRSAITCKRHSYISPSDCRDMVGPLCNRDDGSDVLNVHSFWREGTRL